MRIGLAFASAEIIAGMMKVKDSYNLNRLSMVAGDGGFAGHGLDETQRRAHSTQPPAIFAAGSSGWAIEVYPSHANFVLARKRGRI